MPTNLPRPRRPDNDNLALTKATRAIAWHLVYQFMLFALLVGIILALLLAFTAISARAAGYGYCQLWARAVTEIEVRTGNQWNLVFLKDKLAFDTTEDVDIAVADQNIVELRNHAHYRTCRFLEEFDELPLPDVATVQTKAWAAMVAVHARGKQGTVPATEAPPSIENTPEGWAEACGDQWLTFDPSDGTVVRPASKGGKQRCPLVKNDAGEWIIP
jgi:hypothetical protein